MERSAAAQPAKKDAVALKLFFGICKELGFSQNDQAELLCTSRSTINRSQSRGIQLNKDQMVRISLIAGIYKSACILFGEAGAKRWLRADHHDPVGPFAGKSPYDFIMGGDITHLQKTRRYLDAHRG